MARVTIEDCEKLVPNRFDLVILASQRTRQILNGDFITIPNKDDEKKTVLALREIGAETVSTSLLREFVVKGFRSISAEEDLLEDLEDLADEEDTYNPYTDMEMKSLETVQIANKELSEVDIDVVAEDIDDVFDEKEECVNKS